MCYSGILEVQQINIVQLTLNQELPALKTGANKLRSTCLGSELDYSNSYWTVSTYREVSAE